LCGLLVTQQRGDETSVAPIATAVNSYFAMSASTSALLISMWTMGSRATSRFHS
jgi:hypothetical protein